MRKPWRNKDIKIRGFGGWNLDENNNNLSSDLYKAYCEEFQMSVAINTYKVSFFDQISYFIVDNKDSSEEHKETGLYVKIQVGDVVDLKDISDPNNNSFAMVKAILTHRANNGTIYAFFIFSWLEDMKRIHSTLECAQFRLQHETDLRWRRIFTISMVDHPQRYHFLHDCGQTCNGIQHDEKNPNYLRNDFYFKVI